MENKYQYERSDLAQVRAGLLHLFGVVGIFSVLVNLLLLTGPLYMLHIYDRVLPSGTQQTLVALSLMALLAYTVMGVLDHARARITARIAARFLTQLDQRVFSLAMQSAESGKRKEPQAALKDLSSIENFIASPALLALFDLPWVPVFFAGIYLFHPVLGAMSLLSGLALIGLSLANQWASQSAFAAAMRCSEELELQTQQYLNRAMLIRALGMQSTTLTQQHQLQLAAQVAQLHASDMTGLFTTIIKTLRMALQLAMLGLGAWLVLQEQLSAGGMIATSILFGRLHRISADTFQGQPDSPPYYIVDIALNLSESTTPTPMARHHGYAQACRHRCLSAKTTAALWTIYLNQSAAISHKHCGNINFRFSHHMFPPIAVGK